MEEILCIGLLEQPFRRKIKTGLGFAPQSALEKGLESWKFIVALFPSPSLSMKLQMCSWQMMISSNSYEVGDSDALVVNVIDILKLLAPVVRFATLCLR